MRKLSLFVLSFIVWFLLAWPFRPGGGLYWQNIAVGGAVALLVAFLFGEVFTERPHRIFRITSYFWLLCYIPIFFYYMVIANFDVLYRLLHPKMPINPGIVKVKTSLKSKSGITALCNSITLTPGTLTVDLDDEGYLYIHWINVRSQDVEEASKIIVGRFEKILKKIFE
ncbi:MAG TPA: hypothetical protein EYP53_04310 [Candidatus Latescibacteria bacterium]|nr:hypothetical protein [Candidatus Latescibacterota bacterium]